LNIAKKKSVAIRQKDPDRLATFVDKLLKGVEPADSCCRTAEKAI
jgi:hypothetical protein